MAAGTECDSGIDLDRGLGARQDAPVMRTMDEKPADLECRQAGLALSHPVAIRQALELPCALLQTQRAQQRKDRLALRLGCEQRIDAPALALGALEAQQRHGLWLQCFFQRP